jgi:hypothetical protein
MSAAPLRRLAAASVLALAALHLPGCAAVTLSGGAMALAPGAAGRPAPAAAERVLVTLPAASQSAWARTVRQLEIAHRLRLVQAWTMRTLGVRCAVFALPRGVAAERAIARLARDPRVETVQPIASYAVLDHGDPYLHLQHAAQAMRLRPAHRWATGRGVKVAVIDTGVDYGHPDLAGRIARTGNFVAGDGGAGRGDIHGTAVAGVVAAVAGNDLGIAGVAPEADLFALRACRQTAPRLPAAECDSFSLAKAFDFAVSEGAQVVNLSLTGPRDPLLARLIGAAVRRGVTVVAAARDGAAPEADFPAALPEVLAVRSGVPGRSPPAAGRVLVAPGVDIITTFPGGGYDFLSGSSLAAAHVSGVAALLLERRPGLSPENLARLLRETARPPSTPASGPGAMTEAQVDACRAISALIGLAACGETQAAEDRGP